MSEGGGYSCIVPGSERSDALAKFSPDSRAIRGSRRAAVSAKVTSHVYTGPRRMAPGTRPCRDLDRRGRGVHREASRTRPVRHRAAPACLSCGDRRLHLQLWSSSASLWSRRSRDLPARRRAAHVRQRLLRREEREPQRGPLRHRARSRLRPCRSRAGLRLLADARARAARDGAAALARGAGVRHRGAAAGHREGTRRPRRLPPERAAAAHDRDRRGTRRRTCVRDGEGR